MLLSHRTVSSTAAGARASSSRVCPFTPAANRSSRRAQRQHRLVARAAEEEEQPAAAAAAEGAESEGAVPDVAIAAEDFDFNYSDAKKGNQWQPSDVEAALAYYAGEKFLSGSTELPYESEYVTNPLSAYPGGPEDSSWLADVDNNEAYERDEYSLAGIPEAAPKMKRRDEEEEEDNAEELRALEDEKIGAAAFDDVEGLDEDDDPSAVWNWQFGEEVDAAELAEADARGGAVAPELTLLSSVTEADLTSSAELSPTQKDLVSLVLDPLNTPQDGLDLIGQELGAPDDAAFVGLTQEEEAAIAAVLEAQEGEEAAGEALAAAAELSAAYGTKLAQAAAEADMLAEDPLDEAAVQAYLSALKDIGAAGPGGLDQPTLAELLGGEVAEEAGELGVGLDAETPRLPEGLEAALAAQPPVLAAFTPAAPSADEAAAGEALGLLADIEALAAEVDDFNEAVVPAVEDLQEYEAFIDSALEYYDSGAAAEEEGGMLSERPQDAPINPYEDMDPSLLGADAFGADEADRYADRYGTQFAERILELGRVTKVVKGGKLMGFRCVAVVGDGKGRVGVGCQAGREVSVAVKRALVDAKKNIVEVPLVGAGTLPHRSEAWFKAAGVVLQPAADGTGVIAGGAVRAVLELAGVQNVLGKRLGSRSTLNNARVTLKALSQLRTMDDYADARGLPLDYMLS